MSDQPIGTSKRQDFEVDLGDGVWLPAALIYGTRWWLTHDDHELWQQLDPSLIVRSRPVTT